LFQLARICKKPPWALVLSGGGAKGFAHAGVLKALQDMRFPEPSLVAGTSMGAVIGGVYASGMPVSEILQVIGAFTITDCLDSFAFKFNGPVGKILQTGQLLGSLAGRPWIDSGARILALLEKLTGRKTFAQARIPFRCNAVDLLSGREVVFSGGGLAAAIRASMSYPIFFEPLRLGRLYLVDGGLADNLPARIAAREGFKRILAVDVGGGGPCVGETVWTPALRGAGGVDTAPKILSRCLDLALQRMYLRGRDCRTDLTLYAANGMSPLAFHRKKEFLALGEQAVRDKAEDLERFFSRGLRAYLRLKRRRAGPQEIPIAYTEDTHAEIE
jgi:NTE family protein